METEMSAQIPAKPFKKALFRCLDETFSNVHGIYLDKGTISSDSATIAAQVEHVRELNDFSGQSLRTLCLCGFLC